MIRILFLIHDLGHGGAEKVLVNLVNNMNPVKFDITVLALFGGGINEQFLKPHIHYRTIYKKMLPGNSHIMKMFSPKFLHRLYIKEHYDVEIAYLEGPATRIISGCPDRDTKLISWIHCTMKTAKDISIGFRNIKEACACYDRMNVMAYVSEKVRDAFQKVCQYSGETVVLYNINESSKILELASENVEISEKDFCWCGVGKLVPVKGFDRMIRIQKRLINEGYKMHLYILGEGPLRTDLEKLTFDCGVDDSVSFLGYQTNPYKYVAKCDLFVCSSHSEGYSTAATESLIVGTPVCTVEVSGMKEMLGESNEWGIVTENDEEALYQGIKCLLDDPELLKYYKEKAVERGKMFDTDNTVKAVEDLLLSL